MAVPLLGPKARFLDANASPLSGGKVQTYIAGTTTPKATYTTSAGTVANANPVILDSQGYANIWLGTGDYKIVLLDSNDVVQWTVDNYAGDTAQGFAGAVFPISTNTNITDSYNQGVLICTNTISLNLMPAATSGAGFLLAIYNYGTGVVTIDPNASETINGASTLVLPAGGSVMVVCDGTQWYGLYYTAELGAQSRNLTIPLNFKQGADIASATTTDIGAATGNYINITGTTTITGFGTVQAGTIRYVNFTGALTLTYNATSMILPGLANITTSAGDTATFVSLGSGNWKCLEYQLSSSLSAGLSVVSNYIYVRDEKSSGTPGGGSAAGFQIRTLNTVVFNTITGASLGSNQVTLPAGTYYAIGQAEYRQSGGVLGRLQLYNATDATVIDGGPTSNNGSFATATNTVNIKFTLATSKAVSLRHYIQTAQTTDGLGVSSSQGTEIYAQLQIFKVA